jgi:hypothetical protein
LLGDGILDFTDSLGLGEVGPDYIHAHEFGHAIQFIMDLENVSGDIEAYIEIEDAYSPADDRRNELEADAMAAYALAHEQGRNFELQLLRDAAKAGNAVGDCDVNGDDHHGTPEQRECAVLWGADEGLDMMGNPVTMRQFRTLFLGALDMILALDSSVCSATVDTKAPTKAPTESPTPDSGAWKTLGATAVMLGVGVVLLL